MSISKLSGAVAITFMDTGVTGGAVVNARELMMPRVGRPSKQAIMQVWELSSTSTHFLYPAPLALIVLFLPQSAQWKWFNCS